MNKIKMMLLLFMTLKSLNAYSVEKPLFDWITSSQGLTVDEKVKDFYNCYNSFAYVNYVRGVAFSLFKDSADTNKNIELAIKSISTDKKLFQKFKFLVDLSDEKKAAARDLSSCEVLVTNKPALIQNNQTYGYQQCSPLVLSNYYLKGVKDSYDWLNDQKLVMQKKINALSKDSKSQTQMKTLIYLLEKTTEVEGNLKKYLSQQGYFAQQSTYDKFVNQSICLVGFDIQKLKEIKLNP